MIKDILIVEDEILIAHSLALDLEDAGYNVVAIAASYEEAIAAFQTTIPELVLTDINLKRDKDGVDVASWINASTPRLPIMFMTGYGVEAIRDRIDSVHFITFLEKPVEVQDIINALRSNLYFGEV